MALPCCVAPQLIVGGPFGDAVKPIVVWRRGVHLRGDHAE